MNTLYIVLLCFVFGVLPSLIVAVVFWGRLVDTTADTKRYLATINDVVKRVSACEDSIVDVDLPNYDRIKIDVTDLQKAIDRIVSKIETLEEMYKSVQAKMSSYARFIKRKEPEPEPEPEAENLAMPYEQQDLFNGNQHSYGLRTRKFGEFPKL